VGCGHPSAAEAIYEAIDLEFPYQGITEMADIYIDFAPPL
jgi:hypothetical protein